MTRSRKSRAVLGHLYSPVPRQRSAVAQRHARDAQRRRLGATVNRERRFNHLGMRLRKIPEQEVEGFRRKKFRDRRAAQMMRGHVEQRTRGPVGQDDAQLFVEQDHRVGQTLYDRPTG